MPVLASFKIEGRLKDTGYIRNVVTYYRRALDEVLAARPGLCRASVGESVPDFMPDPAKSFTRVESEYFFDGKHPGVASFDTPKSVGERIGRVGAGRGREFHARCRCGPRPGRRALPAHDRTARRARTSMPLRGAVSPRTAWRGSLRSGGVPELRPAVQPGIGAQPDAARDSGAGRGRGLRRGVFDPLHRLRGAFGRSVAHPAARPGPKPRSQCRGAACAGDEVGRYDLCGARSRGAGRRMVLFRLRWPPGYGAKPSAPCCRRGLHVPCRTASCPKTARPATRRSV